MQGVAALAQATLGGPGGRPGPGSTFSGRTPRQPERAASTSLGEAAAALTGGLGRRRWWTMGMGTVRGGLGLPG